MKIQIQREALKDAMGLLGIVIPNHSPKPVIRCVRVVAEDGRVTLHGTNLETHVAYEVAHAEVEESGEVLIQANLLTEIAKAGRSDVLTMRAKETGCEVTEADARYDLWGVPSKMYPVAPEAAGEYDATMSLEEFRSGVRRTEFAVATEHSRYAIGGVFLKQGNGQAKLVATDGRRLACCQIKEDSDMEAKGIVPPKALKVLAAIPAGCQDPIKVMVKERQAWFSCGPLLLTTNLLEGTFPDYEKVVPKDPPIKLSMNRKAVLRAIQQAGLMAKDSADGGIRLALSKNQASFRVVAGAKNIADVAVPTEYEGGPMEIGFKPEYISDALRAIGTDAFTLELTDPQSPGVIRDGADYLYLFMPLTLS